MATKRWKTFRPSAVRKFTVTERVLRLNDW
jgi:hypothetical protein